MSELAVISDIHGNLHALKAVLDDIKNRGVSEIICLGDIVGYGADSPQCVDVLTPDAELVAALSKDLWSKVTKQALSDKADFRLDSRDLALHPKLRQLVNQDIATATFYPKPTQMRKLKPWFKTRSLWAVHRLRRAIYQAQHKQHDNSLLLQT